MSMNKYSYNYDAEAAEIEAKMEEAKKPPVEHKERDIEFHSVIACILFSCIPIFQFFYVFYWMARINDDLRDLANDYPSSPGWTIVPFFFLTCGFYMFYWVLKQGKRVDRIKAASGDRFNKKSGIGYTLLVFFGFTWIALAMMQNEINNQL